MPKPALSLHFPLLLMKPWPKEDSSLLWLIAFSKLQVQFVNHFSGCQMCLNLNKNGDMEECEREYIKSFEYANSIMMKLLARKPPRNLTMHSAILDSFFCQVFHLPQQPDPLQITLKPSYFTVKSILWGTALPKRRSSFCGLSLCKPAHRVVFRIAIGIVAADLEVQNVC